MNESTEQITLNLGLNLQEKSLQEVPLKPSKKGTQEWASTTVNIANGCQHNCRYCYARSDALRFGRISHTEDWQKESLKKVLPRIKRFPGRVMFPSTHDITPELLDESVRFLRDLLAVGNEVLVVSKPHLHCIERLCREFMNYRSKLIFRFTIGSCCNDLTSFWEPCAPPATERIACLAHAYRHGFTTSVSIEPMLSGAIDAIATFHALKDFVREKIWIGRMNQVGRRVDQRDPAVQKACNAIRALQSDKEMLKLVATLRSEAKVQWKDSISEIVERANAS
jgi:DNA repair photolyase